MKILYVGPLNGASTSRRWRDAFVRLGHDVRSLDSDVLAPWPTRLDQKMIARVRLNPGRKAVRSVDDAVAGAVREFRPEVTFFAHGKHLSSGALRNGRETGVAFVHMGDDMFNPINQWWDFHGVVKSADCIITTKSFNVPELRAIGAARVEFLPYAYDPEIHYPALVSADESGRYACDLGFLGTFRPERADYLERVLRYFPRLTAKVWGGNWGGMYRWNYRLPKPRWPLLKACVTPYELWGDNYSKAIRTAGIVLGLLNHANRDLHTCRTFEIPASGGFFLAERTPEHQLYFEEDKEAAYFDSLEELVDKVGYYSNHPSERRRIAAAGRARCVNSAYRYTDRAASLLQIADELKEGSR